jgi:uncharacterized membrane protein YdjX (TVP38/TMEM64 family)
MDTRIFLLSILTNATVLIPLPGVVFTSAMGAVFDPFWVAVASGSGATLVELSGYMAGVGGQVWLTIWIGTSGWNIGSGSTTIGQLSCCFHSQSPFDMAGFIAGAGKVPLWKFLLFTWIGKIAKMLMFAYLGAGNFQEFLIFQKLTKFE